jgi:hypothetical protein
MKISADERRRRDLILDYMDHGGKVWWRPRRFWLGITLECIGYVLISYFLYWVPTVARQYLQSFAMTRGRRLPQDSPRGSAPRPTDGHRLTR